MEKANRNEKYQKRKLNQEREKEQRLKNKQAQNNLLSSISQFNPKQFIKFMEGPFLGLYGKQKSFAQKQIIKMVRKMSKEYYPQYIKNQLERVSKNLGIQIIQEEIDNLISSPCHSSIYEEKYIVRKLSGWLFKTGNLTRWNRGDIIDDSIQVSFLQFQMESERRWRYVILRTPSEYRLTIVRPEKIIRFLKKNQDFKQRVEKFIED